MESTIHTPIESNTRLHGRWLLVARVGWITAFIMLTLMYVLGFLAVHEALSTVCEEELCTLRQQIRHTEAGEQVMDWGDHQKAMLILSAPTRSKRLRRSV